MAKIFNNLSPHYTEVKALAGADLTAGTIQTVNEVLGFTLVDVANTDEYSLVIRSDKVEVDKDAVTIAAGEAIYWNDATDKVTNIPGSLTLIGYAIDAEASGSATCKILFDGTIANTLVLALAAAVAADGP